MNKKTWFVVVGIFWMIILGGFIITKEFIVQTGTEILLKTEPVDPRDLFRGDYVVLRYEISRINHVYANNIKEGDWVYVILSLDANNVAHVLNVSKRPPRNGVFIKGRVINRNADSIDVEYGIESYFISEGSGHEIERHLNDTLVRVVVDA